jgi:hypothetical protein
MLTRVTLFLEAQAGDRKAQQPRRLAEIIGAGPAIQWTVSAVRNAAMPLPYKVHFRRGKRLLHRWRPRCQPGSS